MSKTTGGTHRSMGKKGGASSGMESGLVSVESFKAGQGAETHTKTQRPKKEKGGSIAV